MSEKRLAVVIRRDAGGRFILEVRDLSPSEDATINAFVVDRMVELGPAKENYVRTRAHWLAEMLGLPMVDETQPAEPEKQPDAAEELRAEIAMLREEIDGIRCERAELWTAIANINSKVQP